MFDSNVVYFLIGLVDPGVNKSDLRTIQSLDQLTTNVKEEMMFLLVCSEFGPYMCGTDSSS